MSDFINGLFELIASCLIFASCLKLHYHDKKVAGIWWPQVAFFASWGFWNLWFYPSVGCYWSFVGGCFVVLTNTIWLLLLLKYRKN